MTTKLPGIPALPKDLPPEVAAYLNAVTQSLQVRLGQLGDPLDRAVTLRELINAGLAEGLKASPFDPNEISDSNIGFVAPIDSADLSIPPAPTGLSGDAGFKSVILSWSNGNTQFGNFAFSEVFRHTSDVIGDAVRVAVVTGNRVTDQVDTNSTYYYWVRHVSTANIVGPFNSTSGLAKTTLNIDTPDIQDAAIINAKIADATIENAKIASLDATKITTGQLSANRISVDGATITADGSGQLKIADLGVGSAQINNAAVTTAKIGTGQITNALIGSLAVNTGNIANLNVTRLKIANGAVSNVISDTYQGSSITLGNAANTTLGVDLVVRCSLTLTASDTFHIIAAAKVGGGTANNGDRTHDLQLRFMYRTGGSDPFLGSSNRVIFYNNSPPRENFDAEEKQQFAFTTIPSASTTRTAIFALGGTARAGGGGSAGASPGRTSNAHLTIYAFAK